MFTVYLYEDHMDEYSMWWMILKWFSWW